MTSKPTTRTLIKQVLTTMPGNKTFELEDIIAQMAAMEFDVPSRDNISRILKTIKGVETVGRGVYKSRGRRTNKLPRNY